MKPTGIVRRIDDLGRVVIPKEIRRTLRIREGDPLEIYTDRDGEVIFKKYSPIAEIQNVVGNYSDVLNKTIGVPVFISDRYEIISLCGLSKKEFLDSKITQDVDNIIRQRSLYISKNDEHIVAIQGHPEIGIRCIMPIMSAGDIIGSIFTVDELNTDREVKVSIDTELKLIYTIGLIIGKQMEE